MNTTNDVYDVAILGSGMSGPIIASILAKHGARVVMIDKQPHPRFAVGESTIPHTSLLLSILAERYGVPELENIAHPERVAEHVAPSSGIKRSFGFAYHREGQPHDPREAHQFGTASKDESHLFRQDVDAYLTWVAMSYGAELRTGKLIKDVDIDDDRATVEMEGGESIRARYVVDGTGWRSVLADKFELRENPCSIEHRTRCLFTHMLGVGEFMEGESPMALPWSKSTLHHCFDGGWIWVIPFNNYAPSRNPLVSVGLTIDLDRFPKTGVEPEAEFRQFLARFPSVVPQFADARAVRPWVSTDRLQYMSTRSCGYRFALMAHSAAFTDALFSRGLINTFTVIYKLLDPLMAALDDGDFSQERFEPMNPLVRGAVDFSDKMAWCSYAAWSDFDLWDAWLRVWGCGTLLTEFRIMDHLARYSESHDLDDLRGEATKPAFSDFEDPDYGSLFREAVATMKRYKKGEIASDAAAADILQVIGRYPLPPMISTEGMRRAGWLAETERLSERSTQDARDGFRWALGNPASRDLFGTPEAFLRWRNRRPDVHLTAS